MQILINVEPREKVSCTYQDTNTSCGATRTVTMLDTRYCLITPSEEVGG